MIELIIILMYIALGAALGTTLWAIIRTIRIIGKTSGRVHGVPVRRIKILTWATIIAVVIISLTCMSTEPLHINTATYSDTFWLRMANMFVFTSTFVICIATIATIYNVIKSHG